MLWAKREADDSALYRTITSILLYGLLAEWLLPWLQSAEWSELFHPEIVLILMALVLLAGLFKLPLAWNIVISCLLCILSLMYIYRTEDQSVFTWVIEWFPQLGNDIADIFVNGIWNMSMEIRSILLFSGWLLLIPALQSIVWMQQISFSIMILTVIYLLGLHFGLGFDVFWALLRTMTFGLLLMSVTTLPRVRRKLVIRTNWRGIPWRSFAAALLCTCSIVVIAMWTADDREREFDSTLLSSLWSEEWAQDLEAFSQGESVLNRLDNHGHGLFSNKAQSGYGLDDSRLGGALKLEDDVIFRGWSSIEQYWRGESKSYYDGKGWKSTDETFEVISVTNTEQAFNMMNNNKNENEQLPSMPFVEQEVQFVTHAPHFPIFKSGITGVVTQLYGGKPNRELKEYLYAEHSNTLLPPVGSTTMNGYTVLTQLSVTDENILRAIEEELSLEEEVVDAQYLQLPEQLPDRVSALAAEVSGGGLTKRYDQVKAIEQYLKSNYEYSLQSSHPGENDDFVDHFLFSQNSGYCVHFSTAMVVMLRTQGIPARYVKGFISGDPVDERVTEDGVQQTLYEVSTKHAHAWVEVYFPQVGWVPFDPTPGYDAAGSLFEQESHTSEQNVLSSLQQQLGKWGTSVNHAVQQVLQYWRGEFIYIAVLVTGLLCAAVLYLKNYKLRRSLKKYRMAYERKQVIDADVLQLAQDDLQNIPLRTAGKDSKPDYASKLEKSHFYAMQMKRQLLECAELIVGKLENRADTFGRVQTWRERVNRQAVCLTRTQQKKLSQLLSWVEECQYKPEQEWKDAPDPQLVTEICSSFIRRPWSLRIHRRVGQSI